MDAKTAVGYVRVSTQEQVRGVSLDAQVERLKAYAVLAGLELVEVVREEGVSAATPLAQRPGGQRVLQLVTGKRPAAYHVIALKLDRLFRDAADALNETRAWDRAGTALHLVDMGGQSLNTASAMGRMILTMMAGFAELERNLIAERTCDALAHKKANGKAYSPTPLGFRRQGDQLTADPAELRTVRQVRGWRAAGWTYRRIAQELTARGAKTKTGGRWHAATVRYIAVNALYDQVAQ